MLHARYVLIDRQGNVALPCWRGGQWQRYVASPKRGSGLQNEMYRCLRAQVYSHPLTDKIASKEEKMGLGLGSTQ